MEEDLGGLIQIVFALGMLLVAFFVGEWIERRHYKRIRAREEKWRHMPCITLKHFPIPEGCSHDRSGLVTGHVVISVDHFKRFVANLRGFFGGRIRTYETLLDRARREAMLRMKLHALTEGYHAVINVRYETSTVARSGRGGKNTAGVEVLAFGTGIRMTRASA